MRTPAKGIFSLVGFVIIFSFLTSCSRGSTQEPEVITESQPSQNQTGTEAQDIGTGGADAADNDVAEDIPVMVGGRRLEVARDGSNISYEVDGTIEDVVAFYQEQLPNYGWEMTRSPDNVVGAMATMARTNEAGDRITFSLQYNPMGEFVVIRIVRLKAP